MRRNPRKTQRNRLDKKWSLIIRRPGKCEICGSLGPLNAHHIFGSRYISTRWDLDNGICLCVGCHHKAHERSLVFAEWIKNKRGYPWYIDLRKRHFGKPERDLDILEAALDDIGRAYGIID